MINPCQSPFPHERRLHTHIEPQLGTRITAFVPGEENHWPKLPAVARGDKRYHAAIPIPYMGGITDQFTPGIIICGAPSEEREEKGSVPPPLEISPTVICLASSLPMPPGEQLRGGIGCYLGEILGLAPVVFYKLAIHPDLSCRNDGENFVFPVWGVVSGKSREVYWEVFLKMVA